MNGIIIGFQDVYMCMTLRNQIKIRERWPKTTHCTALIVVVYKYTHKHEGIYTHTYGNVYPSIICTYSTRHTNEGKIQIQQRV